MFNKFRQEQFAKYNEARQFFLSHPEVLENLEKYFSEKLYSLIEENIQDIVEDYNEASMLYPFWQNYPADERGRMPRGDQYPWIEVGEHAVGDKLTRLLGKDFKIKDTGLPTGPDKRFILKSEEIDRITNGYTDSVWLFVDIKSVGPRDDFDHAVMSHNQISGDGSWSEISTGVKNSVMLATGKHRQHEFHCSIPPLYILSNGTCAPVINIALKPVYKMLALEEDSGEGQPLKKITLATIPNGLLLLETMKYLKKYPSLFYPGKDDKGKNPLKVRCRVDFKILRKIAQWRVADLNID